MDSVLLFLIDSMRRILTLLPLFLLVIACSQQVSKSQEPIKIGVIGSLSGPVAYLGEQVIGTLRLALEEKSTLNGRPIELVVEDGACDAKKAVSAAQKLIQVDRVRIIVVDTCSNVMLSVAPLAEEAHVILITPVATSPAITNAGDYAFRISGSATPMAEATAEMLKSLSIDTIGVLFEQNDFTVGWKDAFMKAFLDTPQNKIIAESYRSDETDVKTQLTKLSQNELDALFFLSLAPISANRLLKQYAELGIDIPLVGNEIYSFPAVMQEYPEVTDGMLVPTYKYDLTSERLQELLQKYERIHGKKASEEIYAALAYDLYQVLYSVLGSCRGTDTECLKEKLYSVKDYNGISGMISIDKNGDTEREYVLRTVKDGKLIPYSP